jgi:hypothetical protein
MATWQSVPEEKFAAWSKLAGAQITSSSRLACRCPVCAVGEVRFFFVRGARLSHGSAWFWCPECRTAEHSQSLVPSWWTWTGDESKVMNADLNIGEPFDVLDEMWDQINAQNPASETAQHF